MIERIRIWFQRWRQWPVSKMLKIPPYTPAERRGMIRNLIDHPGWIYLMAELDNRKAHQEQLQKSLTRQIPQTMTSEAVVRELVRINEAVFWLGWIQDKVARANALPNLGEYVSDDETR